jgi:pilus assembly protein CpaF
MMPASAPDAAPTDGSVRASLIDELCSRVAEIPGDAREIALREVAAVAPLVHGRERDALVAATVARLVGMGPLEHLLADSEVTEVLVNGTEVWIERHGRLERSGSIAERELDAVLERILAPIGRRLDQTHPVVDARLGDGSRLCAVIAPVAVDGTAVSIRRTAGHHLDLDAFATPQQVQLLHSLIERRLNIVISGGTSTGKTSLLGSMLAALGTGERLVVVEDTAELHPPGGHLIRFEARPASPDGPPPIDLEQLVRTALRLRPDRLVVGEVRGPEVLALMQAINTGHDGSLTTVHANSADDALVRLETLTIQTATSWPLIAVRDHLARSTDIVIQMTRTCGAQRRVREIVEVVGPGGPDRSIVTRPLSHGGVVTTEPTRDRR